MPTTTRQKLVEAATKRFYRDGFRNVGIDQILADVGISKTAFYKHFDSKDDLMLEALDVHDRMMQETFRNMARQRGGEDPVAQLRALFDVVEVLINGATFQGCIFVNAAIEFPLPHEPAHVAAARSKQAMEDVVTGLAAAAGAKDARGLSQELCLLMEGVYVTRHVTGKSEWLNVARRLAERAIGEHLNHE
ncbi:MAG: TetR/AcrR family transcriptional regulator [Pirellulales bacterium]|nr:TetR/AcrR family transcriptional regulator [Pirellulales bacterium]